MLVGLILFPVIPDFARLSRALFDGIILSPILCEKFCTDTAQLRLSRVFDPQGRPVRQTRGGRFTVGTQHQPYCKLTQRDS